MARGEVRYRLALETKAFTDGIKAAKQEAASLGNDLAGVGHVVQGRPGDRGAVGGVDDLGRAHCFCSSQTIHITGGTGFVGTWLLQAVAALNRRGADIRVSALTRDLTDGTADLRQLHREGWTEPRGRTERFLADLLSCPICVSFHALWLARVATGRARPLSTRWWLRLFAGWGAAQVLLRLPSHSGAKESAMYVQEALNEASREMSTDAVHQV